MGGLSQLETLAAEGILHLHWTQFLSAHRNNSAEVRESHRSFLELLDRRREAGAKFVWTIHEPLPHDCHFPEEEARLRNELAMRADAIHMLHPSTMDEIGDLFAVPRERVFSVRHPLFTGFYPDYVPRESARGVLGLADGEIALLGFGALRPYKGFDRLPRVADRLESSLGRQVRLIIAGPTMNATSDSGLLELARVDPRILLLAGPVPASHVQVLFRAADLAVLPYRHGLNSSVLMLALTFGLRTVVPDTPPLRDLLGSGLVHLFPMHDDATLAQVVVAAVKEGPGHELPTEVAREFAPAPAARAFAGEISQRLFTVGDRGGRPGVPVQSGADKIGAHHRLADA